VASKLNLIDALLDAESQLLAIGIPSVLEPGTVLTSTQSSKETVLKTQLLPSKEPQGPEAHSTNRVQMPYSACQKGQNYVLLVPVMHRRSPEETPPPCAVVQPCNRKAASPCPQEHAPCGPQAAVACCHACLRPSLSPKSGAPTRAVRQHNRPRDRGTHQWNGDTMYGCRIGTECPNLYAE
jgi:hypothetical protein